MTDSETKAYHRKWYHAHEKPDRRAYSKEYYKDNKDKWKKPKSTTATRVARNQAFMRQYKQGLVCVDCGYDNPICFDFHHVGDDKVDVISNLVSGGYSLEKIKTELSKCVCLCANCHRIRHHSSGWKRQPKKKPSTKTPRCTPRQYIDGEDLGSLFDA